MLMFLPILVTAEDKLQMFYLQIPFSFFPKLFTHHIWHCSPAFQICFSSLPNSLLSTWNPHLGSTEVPLQLQRTFISLYPHFNLLKFSFTRTFTPILFCALRCMFIRTVKLKKTLMQCHLDLDLFCCTLQHLTALSGLSDMSCTALMSFAATSNFLAWPEPFSALCLGLSPNVQRHSAAPPDMLKKIRGQYLSSSLFLKTDLW